MAKNNTALIGCVAAVLLLAFGGITAAAVGGFAFFTLRTQATDTAIAASKVEEPAPVPQEPAPAPVPEPAPTVPEDVDAAEEDTEAGDEAVAEAPASGGDAPPSNSGTSCSDKIDGVTRHSSTRYTLSQGFMDKYVRNQGRAQKQGNANWRKNKKKEVVGVRLKGLNCAPVVAGLQNNDVIKEVNGRAITSTASALSAYSDLSSASRFTIKLRRDKSSMTINYTVE